MSRLIASRVHGEQHVAAGGDRDPLGVTKGGRDFVDVAAFLKRLVTDEPGSGDGRQDPDDYDAGEQLNEGETGTLPWEI